MDYVGGFGRLQTSKSFSNVILRWFAELVTFSIFSDQGETPSVLLAVHDCLRFLSGSFLASWRKQTAHVEFPHPLLEIVRERDSMPCSRIRTVHHQIMRKEALIPVGPSPLIAWFILEVT
jgi:hypothetical protein